LVGRGIAISQITYTAGMYIPSIMGLKLGSTDDESSFYWMKLILVSPSVAASIQLLLYCTIFRMETPQYLMSKNKTKEAKKLINRLYKKECEEEAIKIIKVKLNVLKEDISYKELFASYKKPWLICMLVLFGFATSGCSAI
jgi:hypothetical protein